MISSQMHLRKKNGCFRSAPEVSVSGAGDRTRTCTAMPEEPKSTESTNSTTPAYSFVPLFLHGEVTRGGAFRLIHNL